MESSGQKGKILIKVNTS